MNAPLMQSLPWCEPLALAAAVDEPYWALLYSGAPPGRFSFLAHDLAERVEGHDFTTLSGKLSRDRRALENAWFGYLGYGLKDALERLPPDAPAGIAFPPLCLMRFHSIYRFDHEAQTLTRWTDTPNRPALSPQRRPQAARPPVAKLRSNMTRADYLAKARQVIEAIGSGDIYQANLTRKFMGEFASPPDTFSLFCALCAASPAAYSAYLRLGERHVLSSSPELFLDIGADGHIASRPIKGTVSRGATPEADQKAKEQLAASTKDRAENLMIVDLMRNDFAKGCVPGSIGVSRLYEISTHAHIHHMASTITGRLRPGVPALEAVAHCFPPGSMTGAPKIRAMALCTALERQARGPYSGALGWFGGDGSASLSVIIRTLLVEGRAFEFQTGGGIVADSTPEAELSELLAKAAGLGQALGIAPNELEKI